MGEVLLCIVMLAFHALYAIFYNSRTGRNARTLTGGANVVHEKLQGYLAHTNPPPPTSNHHRALGAGLLKGPTGRGYSCERGTPVWHETNEIIWDICVMQAGRDDSFNMRASKHFLVHSRLPPPLREPFGLLVQGAGCRFQGSGFKVQGADFRVQGSGFRVQCSEFRVQVSGLRVGG